jgi:hypothetical protein
MEICQTAAGLVCGHCSCWRLRLVRPTVSFLSSSQALDLQITTCCADSLVTSVALTVRSRDVYIPAQRDDYLVRLVPGMAVSQPFSYHHSLPCVAVSAIALFG